MQTNTISFLRDKKAVVIGLGKSGISVIKKLVPISGHVVAIDNNPLIDVEPSLEFVKEVKGFKLDIILDAKANENIKILDDAKLVVLSPGVSADVGIIVAAEAKNIPVWSELEFGWQLLSDKQKKGTVAVTGTNGKTTVVTLIQKVFNDCGLESVVCGNIGNPLTDTIDSKDILVQSADAAARLKRVIEVSSFQLEKIIDFHPFISILLNITSDHIDRHFSMERYADLKFKILFNASPGDWGIFNIDDRYIAEGLKKRNDFRGRGLNIIKYSLCDKPDARVYFKNSKIFYNIKESSGAIDLSHVRLLGPHNISNIMSVISAAKIYGLKDDEIEASLNRFTPLEHRIEFVADVKGVKVYNDSKATNPDATIKALESFGTQVTLILGGKDKDMDFTVLLPVLKEKVLSLVLIGETKQKILSIINTGQRDGPPKEEKTGYEVIVCDSMEEAVDKGLEITESGNILLLSPACASFDMFLDYKDRGNKFKKLVLDKKRAYGRGKFSKI